MNVVEKCYLKQGLLPKSFNRVVIVKDAVILKTWRARFPIGYPFPMHMLSLLFIQIQLN